MAQYFKAVPLWVIGTCKLIRDVLITITALAVGESAVTNHVPAIDAKTIFALIIIREAIGKFVQYSEKETKAKV